MECSLGPGDITSRQGIDSPNFSCDPNVAQTGRAFPKGEQVRLGFVYRHRGCLSKNVTSPKAKRGNPVNTLLSDTRYPWAPWPKYAWNIHTLKMDELFRSAHLSSYHTIVHTTSRKKITKVKGCSHDTTVPIHLSTDLLVLQSSLDPNVQQLHQSTPIVLNPTNCTSYVSGKSHWTCHQFIEILFIQLSLPNSRSCRRE